MTNEMHSVLSLPPAMLVALGSGYLGYKIAYLGKDDRHKTHDVIFIALVFGALAQVTQMLVVAQIGQVFAAALALIIVLLVSAIWRRVEGWVNHRIIQKVSGSIHDGHKTAWQSLIADDQIQPMQIEVHLKNGDVLYCDDTAQFTDAPHGPMLLGEDGSVALYLTQIARSGEGVKDVTSTRNKEWGDEITHIPASEIARVNLRLLAK